MVLPEVAAPRDWGEEPIVALGMGVGHPTVGGGRVLGLADALLSRLGPAGLQRTTLLDPVTVGAMTTELQGMASQAAGNAYLVEGCLRVRRRADGGRVPDTDQAVPKEGDIPVMGSYWR